MPCYEPDYKHSKGDAILCAVFHKATKEHSLQLLVNTLDYELIGLTKAQVWDWWKEHQELDAKKLKERE